jgi:hypothetical protein
LYGYVDDAPSSAIDPVGTASIPDGPTVSRWISDCLQKSRSWGDLANCLGKKGGDKMVADWLVNSFCFYNPMHPDCKTYGKRNPCQLPEYCEDQTSRQACCNIKHTVCVAQKGYRGYTALFGCWVDSLRCHSEAIGP